MGGMAEVFRAASYGVEAFERLLAVKRVLPSIAEDQEFVDMFIDEAKIAVQLSHPNIGKVFKLGNADGSYFIAMEYVSGKDVRGVFDRARARGNRLDIAMCCHIIKEACEALEYAHNRTTSKGDPLNLIHRDVSPQNLLLSFEGEVKLIDFGIAKAAGKASKTQSGILKGKFGYMSPEQVRGKPIDRRSDVFSLAIVLYELLTLERCFQGEDDFATLEKVRKVDFRRPTLLNRAIPPELERIIYRGLTRNPNDRFQSAAEFQDALQKFLYQDGSFYSRKDLADFMRDTFAREREGQNVALAAFREYARQNIPESRHPDSIPHASISMESFLESTETDPGRGSSELFAEHPPSSIDDGPDTDEQKGPMYLRDYPSSAKTIPRETSRPEPVATPSTSHRLGWLIAISILAIIAGVVTAYYALNTLNPSSLRLVTDPPKTQIYLDGRLLHDSGTPVELRNLEPGEHWLVVSAPNYHREKRQLNLVRGEQLRLKIKLKSQVAKTRLVVETRPGGATVFLDGKKIDQSPLRIPDVEPGEHALRIEKDGYQPWAGRITLVQGRENQVPLIRLPPSKVTITFVPEPANAQISLIDSSGQRTVLGNGVQKVPGFENLGTMRIRAEAPGYVPLEQVVPQLYDLRHTEFLTMRARPARPAPVRRAPPPAQRKADREQRPPDAVERDRDPLPDRVSINTGQASDSGALKLLAVPPARVYVNGRDLGWTPLLNHNLPAGRHAVLLVREEAPSYRKSFTIDVKPGETTFRRFENP